MLLRAFWFDGPPFFPFLIRACIPEILCFRRSIAVEINLYLGMLFDVRLHLYQLVSRNHVLQSLFQLSLVRYLVGPVGQ